MAKKSKPARKTGTAVAVAKPQLPAAPVTFLEFLDRASRDPAVDVGKMQAILDMRAKEEAREAKRLFDEAMIEMQPKLPRIGRKGEIVIYDKTDKDKIVQRTKFARWEDIHKIITPILASYKMGLTHRVGQSADGKITVTGILSHVVPSSVGHREETTITLAMDTTGSKNNVQAVGSTVSYGKRYTASALLNLNFGGEDDDGQAGGGTPDPGTITAKQRQKIDAELAATKSDVAAFLYMMGKIGGDIDIPDTKSIPAALYEQAMAKLAQKREKMPNTNAGRTQ